MNFIPPLHKTFKSLSRIGVTLFFLAFSFATLAPQTRAQDDVPIITKAETVPGAPLSARITFVHCSDTNYEYSILSSSNLVDWLPSNKYPAATSNDTLQIMRPQIASRSKTTFYRILKTPRIPIPVFPMALLTSSYIDLNSTSIRFDSFDSSNTNLSTAGLYDPNKMSDHGDIGANIDSPFDPVDIGNAWVYGKIHTAPGSLDTTVTIGPSGRVGDIDWHQSSQSGIQPGFWLKDLNLTFPDVTPPPGSGLPPLGGFYNGTPYNYLLSTTGGKYESAGILTGRMMVTGSNVILWAKSGMNFAGSTNGIFLAPGASLTIYVGNTNGGSVSCNFSAAATVNTNGVARNFQLYGLPTLTSISMSGGGFVGTIYAPQASLTASGGGSQGKHMSGALIAKSAVINGHIEFHFDEDLKTNGPFR